MTLEAVESATGISRKHLEALESGDFKKLPDLVYSRNFVKALARQYGLDAAPLAKSLVHEISALAGKEFGSRPVNFVTGRKISVTPGLMRGVGVSLGLAGLAGYFAFSVHQILKPPFIEVWSPKNDQAFHARQVALEGRTEPEVELTVNKETVLIEPDGTFSDTLLLPPGVSTLRIAAKKKHSKEQEVFVKVVVEEQASSSTTTQLTVKGFTPP